MKACIIFFLKKGILLSAGWFFMTVPPSLDFHNPSKEKEVLVSEPGREQCINVKMEFLTRTVISVLTDLLLNVFIIQNK